MSLHTLAGNQINEHFRYSFACSLDQVLVGCLFLFQQDGRYQAGLRVGDDSSGNFVALADGNLRDFTWVDSDPVMPINDAEVTVEIAPAAKMEVGRVATPLLLVLTASGRYAEVPYFDIATGA